MTGPLFLTATVQAEEISVAQRGASLYGPRTWSEGEIRIADLDRIAEGLKLVNEIGESPDWNGLIDRSLLPADLQAIK